MDLAALLIRPWCPGRVGLKLLEVLSGKFACLKTAPQRRDRCGSVQRKVLSQTRKENNVWRALLTTPSDGEANLTGEHFALLLAELAFVAGTCRTCRNTVAAQHCSAATIEVTELFLQKANVRYRDVHRSAARSRRAQLRRGLNKANDLSLMETHRPESPSSHVRPGLGIAGATGRTQDTRFCTWFRVTGGGRGGGCSCSFGSCCERGLGTFADFADVQWPKISHQACVCAREASEPRLLHRAIQALPCWQEPHASMNPLGSNLAEGACHQLNSRRLPRLAPNLFSMRRKLPSGLSPKLAQACWTLAPGRRALAGGSHRPVSDPVAVPSSQPGFAGSRGLGTSRARSTPVLHLAKHANRTWFFSLLEERLHNYRSSIF